MAAAARGARLVHLSSDIVFDGTRGRYREDDRCRAGARLRPLEGRGRAAGRGAASRSGDRAHVADLRRRGARALRSGSRAKAGASSSTRSARRSRSTISPVRCSSSSRSTTPGPLHVAGADDISRYDLAVLLGADPGADRARPHDARPSTERLARQLPRRRPPADPPPRRPRGPRPAQAVSFVTRAGDMSLADVNHPQAASQPAEPTEHNPTPRARAKPPVDGL